MKAHFILYVADQEKATEFYSTVLAMAPTLNAPGMTEFELSTDAVLGLMPTAGVERLLGISVPSVASPRAELYLIVASPEGFHARAIASGAKELSSFSDRDWGHRTAYSIDPDGNVLAFAKII